MYSTCHNVGKRMVSRYQEKQKEAKHTPEIESMSKNSTSTRGVR